VPGNVTRITNETQSSAGREFQTTALETARSLAPSTVLGLWTIRFWASADLRCHPLATDETSTQSLARHTGTYPIIATLADGQPVEFVQNWSDVIELPGSRVTTRAAACWMTATTCSDYKTAATESYTVRLMCKRHKL